MVPRAWRAAYFESTLRRVSSPRAVTRRRKIESKMVTLSGLTSALSSTGLKPSACALTRYRPGTMPAAVNLPSLSVLARLTIFSFSESAFAASVSAITMTAAPMRGLPLKSMTTPRMEPWPAAACAGALAYAIATTATSANSLVAFFIESPLSRKSRGLIRGSHNSISGACCVKQARLTQPGGEPAKSSAAMAHLCLLGCRQLGERLVQRLVQKDRIVAESIMAPRLLQYHASRLIQNYLLSAVPHDCRRADETSAPAMSRDVPQLFEQLQNASAIVCAYA